MHTNRKHLIPEVREIFEPSNHAAYTARTKLIAEVREMFEPGVAEQLGADTRHYAALLGALDEATDRGDKLREYVAQMDIAIQEDEGECSDDLGTLESVRRVLRERAEARRALEERERDEASAYAQQLRDRITRGNAFGQRREAELEGERDTAIARVERAEAQLAALREACVRLTSAWASEEEVGTVADLDRIERAERGVLAALANSAAAAEAYTRRVHAKALREAAKELRKEAMHPEPEDAEVAAGVMRAAGRLLEMAIEIERGER